MKSKLNELQLVLALLVTALLSGCGNSEDGKFILDCTIYIPESLGFKASNQTDTILFNEKDKTVTELASVGVKVDGSGVNVTGGYPRESVPAVFTEQFIKWDGRIVDRARGNFSSGEYSGSCKKVEKKF